jgi:hypothetical protein
MALGVERFSLLASALAGRQIDVIAADAGVATWTDGAAIFLDPELGHQEQIVAVAAQAAMLNAGSLRPELLAPLARRGGLIPRYMAVEAPRALAVRRDLLPWSLLSEVGAHTRPEPSSAEESLKRAENRAEPLVLDPRYGTIHPKEVRHRGALALPERTDVHVAKSAAQLQEFNDDPHEQGDDASADVSSPVGGSGALGRMLKKMTRAGRSRNAGPPGAEGATHVSRRSTKGNSSRAFSSTMSIITDDAATDGSLGLTYPEWDVYRGGYRPRWCTVTEVPTPPPSTGGQTHPVAPTLYRPLARVGLDIARLRRQKQGDDIDLDAVVDSRVAIAAGQASADALYVDNVKRRRDLSVLVLLDVSGSSGEPSATGSTVHEHQRATAFDLAASLQRLGDRVAVYAFRSMGRSAVQFSRVKRFDESSDAQTAQRLDALVPGAYTRLGAAIRHASSLLESGGGTRNRLLVVLSDGFAYDHGYEGAYGEADARRALAEARRRGTACVCLSVGAATDAEALRQVFGTAAHAAVPRREQLAAIVGPLFQSALRSAQIQRRSWQRGQRSHERQLIAKGLRPEPDLLEMDSPNTPIPRRSA